MVIELIKDWEKIKLAEEEVSIIGNHIDDLAHEHEAKISLVLAGRLHTNKPFNAEVMLKKNSIYLAYL